MLIFLPKPPQAAYSPHVAFVIFVRFCSKFFSRFRMRVYGVVYSQVWE
jgi:hypothetical protein